MMLCGLKINCYRFCDLINEMTLGKLVITVNAEAIVRSQNDRKLCDIINHNITTIDGQIPLWLFKRAYPLIPIEKISGSDLIYTLPKYASNEGLKIFLLGGNLESNEKSVNRLSELYPSLKISGFSPPFSAYPFKSSIQESIISRIADFQPDILFVGFGMGKQEYWASDNIDELKRIGIK